LGNALSDLCRSQQAESSYKKAIDLRPEFAEAYGNLGNVLKQLGKYDEAKSNYEKAVSIRPELQGISANLGRLLMEQNQHEAGLKIIRQACGGICFDMVNGLSIS